MLDSKNIIRELTVEEAKKLKSYSSEQLNSSSINPLNWQAAVINGTADFMAGRFKQESFHWALTTLFKKIKQKGIDSTLVVNIFPKTYQYVSDLYGENGNSYYTADLLLLRDIIKEDMATAHLSIVANSNALFPNMNNKVKDILQLGAEIVRQAPNGLPIQVLIDTLAQKKYNNDTLQLLLQTANLFTHAYVNVASDTTKQWVKPQLLQYTANITAASNYAGIETHFFYGLLYKQLIQLPTYATWLQNIDAPAIAQKIQKVSLFINQLQTTHSQLKKLDFNLSTPESKITFIKNMQQSFLQFFSIVKNESVLQSYFNINDKLLNSSSQIIAITEETYNKNYQKAISLTILSFREYSGDNIRFARTLSFISDMASISNAEDMEKLLSTHALPIGSSSIKRYSRFNISLNGYVGGTGGFETAFGNNEKQTRGNIGLSAPIGITFTVWKGRLSLFNSFLDLGTIVNQRLNNDTTAYTNFRFEQFFSPGLGVFYNIKSMPLSFGFHYAFIPNLRNIQYKDGTATITETNTSVSRINFSLLVDIPFYTIFNREKKR